MIKKLVLIIIGLFLVATPTFALSTTNLFSYYDMETGGTTPDNLEGTTTWDLDGTGFGNRGTTTTSGFYGSAIDYEESNNEYNYNSAGGHMTASSYGGNVWVKVESLYNWQSMTSQGNYVSNGNWWGIGTSGQVRVHSASGGTYCDTGTGVISTGTWHMISMTRTPSNILIWVDGNLEATCSAQNGISSSSSQYIGVGTRMNGVSPTNLFDGIVDEVAWFSTGLVQANVTELYNGGYGLFYNSTSSAFDIDGTPEINTANLKAYFNLNETSGTTANNLVSGGTDGSWSNSANQGANVIYQNGADLGLTDYLQLDTLHYGTGTSGTNEITISGWFEINSTDSPTENNPNLIAVNNPSSPYNFEFFLQRVEGSNNGNLDLTLLTSAGSSACSTSGAGQVAVSSGIHHIVMRAYTSGGTNYCDIYIDGSSYKSGTGTGTWNAGGTSPFYIGSRVYNNNDDYEGKVDEIAVWDKVLDTAQITALYNSGSGQFYNGSSFSAPEVTLLTDLTSYYQLEESGFNYADSHGSRPFTTGTATTQTTGKINYGQEFDGTTDYLEAGGGSWGTFGTISMWLNPDDDTDKNILGDDSSSGIQMYFDGGGGLNLYDVGNNKLLAVGASAVGTGSWQHVVFVADGASSAVYVNGVSITPTTNTLTGQLTTTGNMHLGTRYSLDKKYDGKIDEVGVWSRALNSSEVSELYNSGSGLPYSSFGGATPNTPPTITPIADQTMNEDTRLNVTSAFNISDAEDPISNLTLSYSSSNTALINSTGSITFNVNTTTGVVDMLDITPNANAYGGSNITVTVTDSGNLTNTSTFLLTVFNVNDAPTITPIANQTMVQGNTIVINFNVTDIDNPYTDLTYSTNSLPTDFTGVFSNYDGTNQTLSLTVNASAFGTQFINVTVQDLQPARASSTFYLRVNCNTTALSLTSNSYGPPADNCFEYDLGYNPLTKMIYFEWDDYMNTVDEVKWTVFRTTAGSRDIFDSTSSTANSGNLTYNYTTNPNDDFYVVAFMKDLNRTFISTDSNGFIELDDLNVVNTANFGALFENNDSIVYSVLIILLFLTIGVASQSATLTLLLSVLGLFIASKFVMKVPSTTIYIITALVLMILGLVARLRND